MVTYIVTKLTAWTGVTLQRCIGEHSCAWRNLCGLDFRF